MSAILSWLKLVIFKSVFDSRTPLRCWTGAWSFMVLFLDDFKKLWLRERERESRKELLALCTVRTEIVALCSNRKTEIIRDGDLTTVKKVRQSGSCKGQAFFDKKEILKIENIKQPLAKPSDNRPFVSFVKLFFVLWHQFTLIPLAIKRSSHFEIYAFSPF